MHRIRLENTKFEGRNNAYLLDRSGVALIDTGLATSETRRGLEAGLAEHGYGFADVDAVVLTHWHPDHAGLAGEIQAAGGAEVYVHAADAPIVRQDPEAIDAMQALRRSRFAEWGMPDRKLGPLIDHLEAGLDLLGEPPAVETIDDGDRLEVGGTTLEAVHAPGHAAGLCCFAFDGDGGPEAFSGDAVLPVYTPNIGGADVRVDRPLETYRRTLESLAERGFERFYPGHRDPIDAPAERALAIVDHHRERTDRVLGVLREHGPADAWTVSAHLFGELEGVHVMHGPGEAFAHLDHLEDEGVAERDGGEYRLVDAGVEAADLV